MVSITPVAAGSATITITATDTANQTATQTIAVTVEMSNAAPAPAPVAVGTIAAHTLTAGADAMAIDVASNFSDTDALTYSAVSSDDTKATVSVTGSMVSITPVAAGSATITITATDTANQTATQTIAVTVEMSNAAPAPAPVAVGTIAAHTLTAGADAMAIDVASNFSDTDALTYSAVSSDDTKATVSVTGSMVSITPVAAGSATITITATDTAEQAVEQTIAVTVLDRNLPTPPTVDISLVPNSLDTTAKTFRVKFEFTKVIDGADVLAAFTADNVKVTSDATGISLAGVTIPVGGIQGLLGGRSWVVTINYEFADLPLYVGVKDIMLSGTIGYNGKRV